MTRPVCLVLLCVYRLIMLPLVFVAFFVFVMLESVGEWLFALERKLVRGSQRDNDSSASARAI
jgi:hypothetical protein